MKHDGLTLRLHNTEDLSLIFITLQQLEQRSGYSFSAMHLALEELVENTLEHAYEDPNRQPIDIEVTFSLEKCKLQVILQEHGKPFDFTPYLSEAIDHSNDHSKGFYRIYDLVDTFYFASLGKEGKRFTLVSRLSNCHIDHEMDYHRDKEPLPHIDDITVRLFSEDDAEAISSLIYKNYDYTYYKPFFYDPSGVKTANKNSDIHSIAATYNERVIGHFALVPHHKTNSAEVAVAVVHPEFKGIGIMNRMFDILIEEAKKRRYRSIFGEAIMLHPYSQKANLKKGMKESALVLGLVPDDIEIEHNLNIEKRSGVLLGYLLFTKEHSKLRLPKRYSSWIEKTLAPFELNFTKALSKQALQAVTTHIDRSLNLSAIQIDLDVDTATLTQTIETLMLEQTAMI